MKLYFVPSTRSTRPRWLLEELGVPYELVPLDRAQTKSPEHLARHPLGHVPVIEDRRRNLGARHRGTDGAGLGTTGGFGAYPEGGSRDC